MNIKSPQREVGKEEVIQWEGKGVDSPSGDHGKKEHADMTAATYSCGECMIEQSIPKNLLAAKIGSTGDTAARIARRFEP